MTQYVMDTAAVNEGYLRARTLVTPLQDDHVRFSWLVAVTVLLAGWLWGLNKYGLRQSWPLPLIIAWLVIYLHILSARTGLLSFYFMLLAVIFWLVARKAKPIRAWGLLLLVVALPFAAYLALPTFRNKVKYIKYDFEYFKDAHYLPGGNDATRVISLKAGWELMNGSKLKGVGFGDINKETQDWYAVHYPQMIPSDKILPSSEWLIYGAGCGLVGFLVFTCIVFLPFFLRSKNRKRWWLLNGMVALSFLFDIGLEVQFGIFVYCFVVLMGWKWFSMEPGKT
jgi:O-antigen ligase